MKQNRRHRQLRPRPTRAQINQRIARLFYNRNLLRIEWLFEAAKDKPSQPHLRSLHDGIVEIGDEIAELEQQ
jgi:hypothetical protein